MESHTLKLTLTSGVYYLDPSEENVLGEGNFGKVFKARNSKNEFVAIKILKDSLSEKAFKDFQETLSTIGGSVGKEIAAFKTLNICSNTLKLIDSGFLNGKMCVIMEYCDKGNLEMMIKKEGTIQTKKALNILKQISNGLSGIHELGIMHRDLKPANILISKDEFKIGDFGLVTKKTIVNAEKTGTPLYMAPEVAGFKSYDKSVDIYSLGLILKEMITGRSPNRIEEHHLERFNPKLRELISKMTHYDPRKRPTAKEVLKIAGDLESKYVNGYLTDSGISTLSRPKTTFTSYRSFEPSTVSVCDIDFTPKVRYDGFSPKGLKPEIKEKSPSDASFKPWVPEFLEPEKRETSAEKRKKLDDFIKKFSEPVEEKPKKSSGFKEDRIDDPLKAIPWYVKPKGMTPVEMAAKYYREQSIYESPIIIPGPIPITAKELFLGRRYF